MGRAPTDFLVTESSAKYRKIWKQVVASLQLEQSNYLPYSLRRGGATSAYRQGATLDELLLKGRWKHVATARLYLDQGLQEFTNLASDLPSCHSRCTTSFLCLCQPAGDAWRRGQSSEAVSGEILDPGEEGGKAQRL